MSTSDPTSRNIDPVGLALIGYGYWGANLARNIAASPATEFVGVVESDESARAAAAARYPGITTWGRLEDALDDDRVQAVIVATPASTHAEVATTALEAGRHALVEKPLAHTPKEADDLLELAREKDLTLMVGHTFLYSAPVNRLRDWIQRGELGKVQYIRSERMSLGRVRRDINAFWNFAPHDISILMHVLDDVPVRVNCQGFSFIQPGVEDMCMATLEFSSGVGATVHVSWLDPIKTRLMTVVGDAKMAIYDDVSPDKPLALVDSGVARDSTLGRYQSMSEFQWRTRAGDILIPKIDLVEPLYVEITDFGEACATGNTPRSSAEHGLQVVKVLAAADESMKSRGAPVEIEW